MKNTQINNFIGKYGNKYLNFYIENLKSRATAAATTYYFGKDKKNNKPIYVIVLQKKIFKNRNKSKDYESYLKSILLHEIGHIKKNHFHRKINKSVAEYEAQMWALHTAKKYNLKLVAYHIINICSGWRNLKKNKKLSFYYDAYRKFYRFFSKKNINKWLLSHLK